MKFFFILIYVISNSILYSQEIYKNKKDLFNIYKVNDTNIFFIEDKDKVLNYKEIINLYQSGDLNSLYLRKNDSNFGITNSGIWGFIEISINNEKEILEIAYPPLDNIQIFFANEMGECLQSFQAGDRLERTDSLKNHRHHIFQIPKTNFRYIIIRIESQGTINIPIRLWNFIELLTNDHLEYSFLFFYLGMAISLAVYNLFLYFNTKFVENILYFILILIIAATQLSISGLGSQLFWRNYYWWNNHSTLILMNLGISVGVAFSRYFLQTIKICNIMDGIFKIYIFVGILNIFLAIYYYQYSAKFISLLGIIVPLSLFVASVRSYLNKFPGSQYFLFSWPLMLLSVLIFSFHNNGLIVSNLYTQNSILIGSFLMMLFQSFAISLKQKQVFSEKLKAESEILDSKISILKNLEDSEKEIADKVSLGERTLAELLSKLQEKQSELERISKFDHLTKLKNRFSIENEIFNSLKNKSKSHPISLILIDLDNFKKINDNYGHLTGDVLLSEVANLIQESIPDTCSVGRWGGEEFLILCLNYNIEMAYDLADALRMKIANKSFTNVGKVTASFGVTELKENDYDYNRLFARVDSCLYYAKNLGKNCVAYESNNLLFKHDSLLLKNTI